MKLLIFVCLFAAVFAEPEAESDPAVFYNYNYGHYPLGYRASHYGYALGHNYAYAPHSYGLGYGYAHTYGKRSADSESDSESDPGFVYANYFNTPFNYGYGYRNYAPVAAHSYAAYAPNHYYGAHHLGYAHAGRYYANSAGVTHIAKREAEAESDPHFYYGNNYFGNYATRYHGSRYYGYARPYSYGYRSGYYGY